MTYWKINQEGDNAPVSLTDVDGTEGTTLGTPAMGKDQDDRLRFLPIFNGFLQTYDARNNALMRECLTTLKAIEFHLSLMTGEEYENN